MTHSVIEPAGFLRFGHVSAYDPKRHMARVIFPAMDDVVSAWLPVLVSYSNGNFIESHIDIGTHVACIMAGEGTESGIIAGCFYDDSNTPHTGDRDITCLEFSDGTRLSYDRKNHSLDINASGTITINASGNVTVNSQGNITANSSGDFTANTAGSVSLVADGGATVIGSSNGLVSIDSQFVTIESSERINLLSSSSSIKSSGKIDILSADEINIKAPSVNIEEE